MDVRDGDLRRERKVISANLKETISSRKAERKEELELARKNGVEIILKRNLQQEGGRNPLDIFPKKVWIAVLEKVNGAEDIRNARDVCIVFKEILGKKYFTQVLFSEVMSLERLKNPEHSFGKSDEPKGLSSKTKLRLVSKQWREAVDFYIELGIRNLEWLKENNSWRKEEIPCFAISSSAKDLELIEKVSKAFEESKKSGESVGDHLPLKFFPRNVTVTLLKESTPEAIQSLICTKLPGFFKAVGNQILRFQVTFTIGDIRRAGISWSQMYLQLREWREGSPNLVWLEVAILRSKCTKQEFEELKECLQRNPFPKLAALKKLSMSLSYPPKEPEVRIFKAILEANPHVTELSFLGVPKVKNVGSGSPLLVPIHSLVEISSLTLDWVRFYPDILKASWPLKKVELLLHTYKTPTNVHALFRMLENFETIEWLKIQLKNVLCRNPGFLRLPNVTYFSYEFWDIYSESGKRKKRGKGEQEGMFAIDFIFFMEKLEVFSWTCYSYYPPQFMNDIRKEIIQFGRGKMNLKYSNIWDVLPSLRRVRVSAAFYHEPMLSIGRGFKKEDRQIVELSEWPGWALYDFPTMECYSRAPPDLSPSESDSDDDVF